MLVNCLDVAVSDDDLNSIISRNIPPAGQVSNIRAALQDDHLIFTGQVKILLPINFEATFAMSHTDKEIMARLVNVRPMSAVADQFKNKILEKIVEYAPFAQLDKKNESIRIHVNAILDTFGITSALNIDELHVAEKQLTLKLQGNINL